MKKFLFLSLSLCILFSISSNAQFVPGENWMHSESGNSGQYGTSSNKSYDDLLKDKPASTVIVAVLDSGIDIEHEDLKDNIWVNEHEIPNNGIDDDQNGYIDDIHGWNFIGGKDKEIHHETLEVTRLYAAMRGKYEKADLSKLSKKEKKEYSKFVRYKEEVENARAKAQKSIDQIESTKMAYHEALNAVKDALQQSYAEPQAVDSIIGDSQSLLIGINILKDIFQDYPEGIDIDTILNYVDLDLAMAATEDRVKLDYTYNPDFDAREIIGDNYDDRNERVYGNNRVEGPDALHGTHVAGIIGATRNNGIGMDGMAQHVKLMSVRVVPDGDERDKDVANAIRYAVDNGASIINMSFGKGHSWDKDIVDEAVKYAAKKDVLLVHAAGNNSDNNDVTENYPNDLYEKPTGFLFWKKRRKAENWLEIGALNYTSDETLIAPFSNYGKSDVDLFAPGMGIYATTPDDGYMYLQGTSMASPVVAGAAAVLRSYFPTLNAKQVKEILIQSTSKIDKEVIIPGDREKKAKLSDLCVSGGVLNLYNAILLAAKTKGKKKIKQTIPRA